MRRKKRRPKANFADRVKRNLGVLIALAAFMLTGAILLIIYPRISYDMPEREYATVEQFEFKPVGELEPITAIQTIDAKTFYVVANGKYTITLAGVKITDGYSFGDMTVNANMINLENFLNDGLYLERECVIEDNHYLGYIWLSNDINYESDISEYMYNAMLIAGNMADYSGEECRYGNALEKLNKERPTLNTDSWLFKLMFKFMD